MSPHFSTHSNFSIKCDTHTDTLKYIKPNRVKNTAHELWYYLFYSLASKLACIYYILKKRIIKKRLNFEKYVMRKCMYYIYIYIYILNKVQFWIYITTPLQGHLKIILPLTNHSLQGYTMWRDESINYNNLSVCFYTMGTAWTLLKSLVSSYSEKEKNRKRFHQTKSRYITSYR